MLDIKEQNIVSKAKIMCGRFSMFASEEDIIKEYELESIPELPARYNIAPSQNIPVIIYDEESKRNELIMASWGFFPQWAKDISGLHRLINAKQETLREKPFFRKSFASQRCLIPTSGFYEWDKRTTPSMPLRYHLAGNRLFSFAGLWSKWTNNENNNLLITSAIITTGANSLINPVHDRMPAILQKNEYNSWLNPKTDGSKLKTLLESRDDISLMVDEVSTYVNSPRNNSITCIEPI